MSDEREQALLDRIERELREALDVAPSPELLPRVRAAALAPAARPWLSSWLLPVAACAAALAVAAWLLARSPAPERGAPPVSVAAAPQVARPPVPEVIAAPRALPSRIEARRPEEPEVLVPPGQEEELRRLAAALRSGRVDAAGLLLTEALPPKDLAIAPLEELPPLEVKPLVSEIDSEGVDQ